MTIDEKKKLATAWFRALRDEICEQFEAIEAEYKESRVESRESSKNDEQTRDSGHATLATASFTRTPWNHANGGGGEISIMKGRVFEKVGVNISVVHGQFSEQFRHEIPGADKNPTFWAAGISLVAHMQSPHVPAAHMNTRMIVVGEEVIRVESRESSAVSEPSPLAGEGRAQRGVRGRGKDSMLSDAPPSNLPPQGEEAVAAAPVSHSCNRLWFGGGGDLNPMLPNDDDTRDFHAAFENTCNALDEKVNASRASEPSASDAARSGGQQTNTEQLKFYPAFTKWCDEYFFLPHRNEMRGVGGIFYDYLGLNSFGTDTSPVTSGRFGKGGVTKEATAAGMALAANAPLDWDAGFAFTQDVGRTFKEIYSTLVRRHMFAPWTDAERHHQLVRRGRYAEYNLLYDRGTRFGLMTGGNTEAILMSLPPMAIWE